MIHLNSFSYLSTGCALYLRNFLIQKSPPKFLISLKIAGLSYRLFITSFTFSRHFTNFMANLKIKRGGKSPTEICEIKSAIASDIYVYTSKHILTLIFHPIKFLLKKPLWKNHNLLLLKIHTFYPLHLSVFHFDSC